jgi:hypothetical protein
MKIAKLQAHKSKTTENLLNSEAKLKLIPLYQNICLGLMNIVRTDVKLGLIYGKNGKEFNLKQFHVIFTIHFHRILFSFVIFRSCLRRDILF